MFFQHFIEPSLAIHSYLIGDPKSRRAVVIDPIPRPSIYLQYAEENNLLITSIVETHVHADYLSGAQELKSLLGGKPTIHCSAEGGKEWTPAYADQQVHDGDEVILGEWRLKAFHTPGHTPEHVIWLVFDDSRSKDVPWLAFTGDVLFVGGVGRPDLLGEPQTSRLAHALYNTLFQRMNVLPDSLEIYPTHGMGSWCGNQSSGRSSSSLGYERNFNSWLMPRPEKAWIAALLKDMPAHSPFVLELKKLNLAKREPISIPPSIVRLAEIDKGLIIDLRPADEFAERHMKGSINLPWGPLFTFYASWVVPYDTRLFVVGKDASTLSRSVEQLQLIGHRVAGVAAFSSQEPGVEWASFPVVGVEKVQQEHPFVLDVRRDDEWRAGHIPGAVHLELGRVLGEIAALPKDRTIYVTCRSGHRASIAASLLQQKGLPDVASVKGGMQAWEEKKLPIEKS